MNARLSSSTQDHIILDQFDTWPISIKHILRSNTRTILAYLEKEKAISCKAEKDVLSRVFPLENEYQNQWDICIELLKRNLLNLKFIGFHCTRLTNKEIDKIKYNGLEPLSTGFTLQRLKELLQDRLIGECDFQQLNNRNLSSADNRKGRIFFFHCLSSLEDERGLMRLFRLWGGESIFYHFENDPIMFRKLSSIGTPCIVLGSLNYTDISMHHDVEKLFVNIFINNNDKSRSFDIDSRVNHNIKVLDIITADEKAFEELTGYSKWRTEM